MASRKYEKYILTDLKLPPDVQDKAAEYNQRATRVLWLEDFVMKGSPSIICSWYWKATEKEGSPSHTHDFDEVVGFIGGDPANPHDLGGEVEFWLEDEKYLLTKSCLISVPEGRAALPATRDQSRPAVPVSGLLADREVPEGEHHPGAVVGLPVSASL